jgi:bifunctional NMN adenylyltransferase/nudix hydrolase
MSLKNYDLLVFIGRLRPFHNAHKFIIDEGLKQAHQVLVLVGSAESPISMRNPFTFDEVKRMISHSYNGPQRNRVIIEPLKDFTYNMPAWVAEVQRLVYKHAGSSRIGIIGCNKDESSYYLDTFRQWKLISIELQKDNLGNVISATCFREALFDTTRPYKATSFSTGELPQGTLSFLKWYWNNSNTKYLDMKQEYAAIKKLNEKYGKGPFQTVDSLVFQSGHILLVTRKNRPGKSKLALPGGYTNLKETLFDGAIRELYEETSIKVPEKVIRGSLKYSETFDDPHRSDVGRIITRAHLFMLDDSKPLPKVKGSDDAEKAAWYPIGSLKERDLYEDHFHIIWKLLNSVKT